MNLNTSGPETTGTSPISMPMIENIFRYRLIILLPAFYFFLISGLMSQSMDLAKKTGDVSWEITSQDDQGFVFEHYGGDVSFRMIKEGQDNYVQVVMTGLTGNLDPGKPDMPVQRQFFEVPPDAGLSWSVIDADYKEISLDSIYNGLEIFPAQPSRSKHPDSLAAFSFDSSTYASDAFYPTELVHARVLGIMRDVRLGLLSVVPVQYNPVSRKLRVYQKLVVRVTFSGGNMDRLDYMRRSGGIASGRHLRSMLINQLGQKVMNDTTGVPLKYVIVSDPAFQTALQPFIQWKRKKGFTVIEAYTGQPSVGNTTLSIKSYLQSLYNAGTPSDPAPTYVLFVGDVAQVPAFSGTSSYHITDLYYCEYTGDALPDVYYGRFSATNVSQLQPQIDKTLEYEQYLMDSTAFLGRSVMVSGVDASYAPTWGNGQINYGTGHYFNPAHGINSFTYLYPQTSNSATDLLIRQNVSDGVGYANYTAHGSWSGWSDPSFSNSHVAALQNQGEYPLMVGNCCSTNEFQYSSCFGETLLRTAGKGAMGYIGASNSTYWNEDYYWGVGFGTVVSNPTYAGTGLGAYDRTFHDHGEAFPLWAMTNAEIMTAGNLAVTQSGSSLTTYYWEVYHLMGDPSVMTYFGVPPTLSVSHAAFIPLSVNSFTVTTEPYTYVAISRNGVLHGAALSDSTGIVDVPIIPFTTPGKADIVATRQNRQPYIDSVTVSTPLGPYVIYQNIVVSDSGAVPNGIPNNGEGLSIRLVLENAGTAASSPGFALLSTADTSVILVDSLANFNTLASMDTDTMSEAFSIFIHPRTQDGHQLLFNVMICTSTDTTYAGFSLTVSAPELSCAGHLVTDTSGNNNGRADAGESVVLLTGIQNTGSATSFGAGCVFTTADPFLTLPDTTFQCGDILPGNYAVAELQVDISMAAPQGYQAMIVMHTQDSSGYIGLDSIYVIIGQVPILVLDLDPNTSSGPHMRTAIQQLGLQCDYLTSFPPGIDDFTVVFVCLGIYSNNHVLSSSQGQILASYLQQGGSLYIEGGDTWYYDPKTSVHSLFSISGLSDGANFPDLDYIDGVTGSLASGMSFNYTGEDNWIDKLAPLGGAATIFRNSNPVYDIAVAFDTSGYKTIGASFEFGGLADASSPGTRKDLMEKYLEFFGIQASGLLADASFNTGPVCTGDSLIFFDVSTGGVIAREWDFPGGQPSGSGLQQISVTYDTPGTYDVRLTVSNGFVASSILYPAAIMVGMRPEIIAQPSDTSVAPGDSASFSVQSVGYESLQWQSSNDSGTTWTDLTDGSLYLGTATGILLIDSAINSLNGTMFRCRAASVCDTLYSDPAELSIVPEIILTLSAYSGCRGDFIIPVMASHFNGIARMELSIGHDSLLVEFDSISQVHPSLSQGVINVASHSGRITIDWVAPSAISPGDIKLFDIHLFGNDTSMVEWMNDAQEVSLVKDVNGFPLPVILIGGQVSLNDCPGMGGVVTYASSPVQPLSGVSVELFSNSLLTSQDISRGSGSYILSSASAGVHELNVQTDLPWGGGNSSDALLILRQFVGMISLPGIYLDACDVDASGFVNAVDALLVAQRFTGMISSFAAGDWKYAPASCLLDGQSFLDQDIQMLCTGDINASYEISSKSTAPGVLLEYSGMALPLEDGTFMVPLTTRDILHVNAISLVFGTTGSEAEMLEVVPHFRHEEWLYSLSGSQCRASWYSLETMGLEAGDTLLMLKMRVRTSGGMNPFPGDYLAINTTETELAGTSGKKLEQVSLNLPLLGSNVPGLWVGEPYPNPAGNLVMIPLDCPSEGQVIIRIFDPQARQVAFLGTRADGAGSLMAAVSLEGLAGGLYICRIDFLSGQGTSTQVRKLMVH